MQEYMVGEISKKGYVRGYSPTSDKIREVNYQRGGIYPKIIKELQFAPTRVSDLENKIYLMGDCPSCPSCACINQGVQFLAVIEAPGTVPLLVTMGGIRLAS